MEGASRKSVFTLLCERLDCKNLPALAKALQINSQAVYDAKKKRSLPKTWKEKVRKLHKVDISDLMDLVDEEPIHESFLAANSEIAPSYFDLLVQANKQIEVERSERRELNEEIRKLWAKNEELLRENGELKAENALLKERLKAVSRGGEDFLEGTRTSAANQ